MALGFQDCCNSSSYFYLNGIPATVSQNEFYHIITLEGPAFCATYTTIPALNYLPPTYTLVEMTEYASCETCFAGAPLTCPAQETIFLSQFGPGSISVGTDCSIRTLFPMIVECISTNPTFDGFADGVVRVFVTGGTPPYSFFNLTDNTVFGGALPVVDSVYTLIDGALEGEYPIQVVDAQSDNIITVTCILESPPLELTVGRTPLPASAEDVCDGSIVVGITNGTPPYEIFINGLPTVLTTITNLCAGDYDITVIDSGVGTDQQINSGVITVGSPAVIDYPDDLCLSFIFCNTTFNLTFTRTGTFNSRPSYTCENPEDVGLTILLLRWVNGWATTQQTSNGSLAFTAPCAQPLPSLQIQFSKVSNQTEQPTGTWFAPLGMFQGVPTNVTAGVCNGVNPGGLPAQPTLTFVTTDTICNQLLGQVILTADGGSGAPYQYLINGVVQSSSTIQLVPGNYTATVADGINTSSLPVNFTISQTPPTEVNMLVSVVNTTTQPSGPINLNNLVAGCSVGAVNCVDIYQFYRLTRISIDVTNLPAGQVITGYFKIKTKTQGVFNDLFIENVWNFNNNGGISLVEATKNFIDIDSSFVLVSDSTSPRPNSINTELLQINQSQSCPSTPSIYYSRTIIREYTFGTQLNPITMNNSDIIRINYDVFSRIQIGNNNGCQPALGVQFDVEFIQTSPNVTCYSLNFNDGTTPYVASSKQFGNQTTPSPYTSTVIING